MASRMIEELAESIASGERKDVDEEIHVIASKLMASKLLCDLHRSVYPKLGRHAQPLDARTYIQISPEVMR